MRDSGLLEPASCAKKRRATIASAQLAAALPRLPFECRVASPWLARSAFRRQRIAACSAPRFDGRGLADVLEHAPTPPTPPACASVGRFSFGDSGPPRAITCVPCASTCVAGPRRPLRGTAATTPPFVACLAAGAWPCLDDPPPQAAGAQVAAIASAVTSRVMKMLF